MCVFHFTDALFQTCLLLAINSSYLVPLRYIYGGRGGEGGVVHTHIYIYPSMYTYTCIYVTVCAHMYIYIYRYMLPRYVLLLLFFCANDWKLSFLAFFLKASGAATVILLEKLIFYLQR